MDEELSIQINNVSSWQDFVVNAPLFQTLLIVIVGCSALVIYYLQRRSKIRNAAIVLLGEIRTAEQNINIANSSLEQMFFIDWPIIMPENSWRKYAHLFAKRLDRDEFKMISSFYSNCELLDFYTKRNDDFFWVSTEERARVLPGFLLDNISDIYDKQGSEEDMQKRRDDIISLFTGKLLGIYSYAPDVINKKMGLYLNKLSPISHSPCCKILKKIAEEKN
ncbi:MAG: hypothetical protein LBG64_02445 [Pseudomonadales bacterium]|jgi:hypothetical protein|nr:hypothetical protein [Pseudomonadales bacterium]